MRQSAVSVLLGWFAVPSLSSLDAGFNTSVHADGEHQLQGRQAVAVDSQAHLRREVIRSPGAALVAVAGSNSLKAANPLVERLAEEEFDGSVFWRYDQLAKGDFTISLQFRTNSTAGTTDGWMSGVGLIDASASMSEGDFGLAMGDGHVMFGVRSARRGDRAAGSSSRTIISSATYADDKWHTIVANRDNGTGACSLWVDGRFQRTVAGSSGLFHSSHSLDVGRLTTGHGYFVGLLKKLEIYSQVFTPEEIDEIKEHARRRERAKEYRAVLEELPVIDLVGDSFRRFDRVVQEDFTIVCQFKTNSSAGMRGHWWGGMGLVDAGVPGEANDFGITIGDGHVMFGVGNPDTTVVSPLKYNDGRWHTVLASRTRYTGEVNLWLDGLPVGEAVGSQQILNSSMYLDVGRTLETGGYFTGYMRGIQVFDQVLTPMDLGMEVVPVGTLRAEVAARESQEEPLNETSLLEEDSVVKAPGGVRVVNKNFERGSRTGTFQYKAVPGWASHKTVFIRSGNGAWGGTKTSNGKHFLGLQGRGAHITQNVKGHVKGATYHLTCLVAKRRGYLVPKLQILVGGKVLKSLTPPSTSFTKVLVSYVAKSPTEQIKLENISPAGDRTVFLDRIAVRKANRHRRLRWRRGGRSRRPGNKAPCLGVRAGDRFIELGQWRLGDVDGSRLTMSHMLGEVPQIWWSSGQNLLDLGRAEESVRHQLTTWNRMIGMASGVAVGNKFIQVGLWRLGQYDKSKFSISHVDGWTSQVFVSDGRIVHGPMRSYSTWDRVAGKPSGVHFGDRFIQIGHWRLGDVDGRHASLSHKDGRTLLIFRSDGELLKGPRADYTAFAQRLEKCDLFAPRAECIATMEDPPEKQRRYSTQVGKAVSGLDSKEAWVAQHQTLGQWLQMDLGTVKKVDGAILESRLNELKQWVTKYQVKYSVDGKTWLSTGGQFHGNTEWFWKSTQQFPAPVFARYIRIYPEAWHTQIAACAGLLVCQECPSGQVIWNPPESKRNYTSVLNYATAGDLHAHSMLKSKKAWTPAASRRGEYMQIELAQPHLVLGIVTQGRHEPKAWTTQYAVLLSVDGKKWNTIGGIFLGNRDSGTLAKSLFPYGVWARYVRILPAAWHQNISMRAGVLACKAPRAPLGPGQIAFPETHHRKARAGPWLANGNIQGSKTRGFEYKGIPGWVSFKTVVIHTGNRAWGGTKAASGSHFLGLQGRGAKIQQTVAGHTKGQKYRLECMVARRRGYPAPRLRIRVGGKELKSLVPPSSTFSKITVDYTATAKSMNITLDNLSPGDRTVFLDRIKTSAVATGLPVVQNNDFEKGSSTKAYQYKSVPGWASTKTVFIHSGNGAWGGTTTSSGKHFLGLQGHGARIEQTVHGHVVGQFYQLRCMVARRKGYPAPRLNIVVGGKVVRNLAPRSTAFSKITADYTATSPSMKIKLENMSPHGDRTVFVDKITIAQAKYRPRIPPVTAAIGTATGPQAFWGKHGHKKKVKLKGKKANTSDLCLFQIVENPEESERRYSSVPTKGPGIASKLGFEQAWTAGQSTKDQWMQIDLGNARLVAGLVTQGRKGANEWVTKYQAKYSQDGSQWKDVRKMFHGNKNRETPVKNVFPQPVVARFLRLFIRGWRGKISMRAGVVACQACRPGGMENFQEENRSYSSAFKNSSNFTHSMLDSDKAWSAAKNQKGEWLQFNLGGNRRVMGIVTQGHHKLPMWVSKFQVKYSSDGRTWMDLVGTFSGPRDSNTKVNTEFQQPIKAKFVRIIPLQWHRHISLRAGLLMCKVLPKVRNNNFEFGANSSTFKYRTVPSWQARGKTVLIRSGNGAWGGTTAWAGKYFLGLQRDGASITQTVHGHIPGRYYRLLFHVARRSGYPAPRLRIRVGKHVKKVFEPAFTKFARVSVEYLATAPEMKVFFENVSPHHDCTVFLDHVAVEEACDGGAVLNLPEVQRTYSSVWEHSPPGTGWAQSMLGGPEAWCANHNRQGQWMQFDLGTPTHVSGVVTQGHAVTGDFVRKYRVEHSQDGVYWTKVNGTLAGNTDSKSAVVSSFRDGLVARFIRLVPLKWTKGICMRAGLSLCKAAGQRSDFNVEAASPKNPIVAQVIQHVAHAYRSKAAAKAEKAAATMKGLIKVLKGKPLPYDKVASKKARKAWTSMTRLAKTLRARLAAAAKNASNAASQALSPDSQWQQATAGALPTPAPTPPPRVVTRHWWQPPGAANSHGQGWGASQHFQSHHQSEGEHTATGSGMSSDMDSEYEPLDPDGTEMHGEYVDGSVHEDFYGVHGHILLGQGQAHHTPELLHLGQSQVHHPPDLPHVGYAKLDEALHHPLPQVHYPALGHHGLGHGGHEDHGHVPPGTRVSEDCPGIVDNPPEAARTYSSVFLQQLPGEHHAQSMLDSAQAWVAGNAKPGEWLQLNLESPQRVVAVVVQGRRDYEQWVTGYGVKVSDDGVTWKSIETDFTGCSDKDTKVTTYFPFPVPARFVRLVVYSYHSWASMRAAVMVCQDTGEPSVSGRDFRRQSLDDDDHAPLPAEEVGLEKRGYHRCASEGEDCTCDGIVVYGNGSSWRSLRVEGKVLCTARQFQDVVVGPGQECRCRSMAWCYEAEKRGASRTLHDAAHRRRVATGRVGRNLHQRRRECGWGPRDCTYAAWGAWGTCTEECTMERHREVAIRAMNGGSCNESLVERIHCVTCSHRSASYSQ